MTSVLKILESLDREDGLEVSKLEKSLKLTKKLDRDNLNIAIKALTKLGIVQNINNEPNRIQVAKRKRNGLYTYFGEIINSDYCYGPSVNNNLLLLFWYQKYYIINNPIKQNLFLKNDQWFLSEDSHKEIELIEMNKLKKQEAGVEITTVPSTSKGIQENIVLNTKNIQPPL